MKNATSTQSLTIDQNLVLTNAQVSDAAELYLLIESSRLYLREWLPFVDYSHSTTDTELYLRSVTAPGNLQDQVYIIRYQGQAAGLIGYKTIDRTNSKLEIGYWLGELFQRKGIMVRSCEALVQYAFEKMRMNRVQIKVGVGNQKSSRIPQRLHFVLEGIERDGEWLGDRFIDLEVYSMLKKDWMDRRQKATSGGSAPSLGRA